MARRLHREGAAVALVDIDAGAVERSAAQLGDRAMGIGADVRDRAVMAAAVDAAVGHLGRLDIVVANAGVIPTPATLRMRNDDNFDRVLGINLFGVYNTVTPALEQVIEHQGHVVVVSSAAAFTPSPGGLPYMISKAGVEQQSHRPAGAATACYAGSPTRSWMPRSPGIGPFARWSANSRADTRRAERERHLSPVPLTPAYESATGPDQSSFLSPLLVNSDRLDNGAAPTGLRR